MVSAGSIFTIYIERIETKLTKDSGTRSSLIYPSKRYRKNTILNSYINVLPMIALLGCI
jgi:hypothetical protein